MKEPKVLTVFTQPPLVAAWLIPLTLRFTAGSGSQRHTPLPHIVTEGLSWVIATMSGTHRIGKIHRAGAPCAFENHSFKRESELGQILSKS